MKILAIGDPHGKLPKNLNKIVKGNKIEVIVCIGDVPPVPKNAVRSGTVHFSKEFLKKADKSFKDIVKKLCSYELPILILKGNMYTSRRGSKVARAIFSKYKNLIYKKTGKVRIKGVNFILFDMIYEKHSHSYHTKAKLGGHKKREPKLNKMLKGNRDQVLLSHTPPFGYVDKTHSGKHIGSKILLNAIKKHQPKLVLCGHIHEARGQAKIGKTHVMNLGYEGDYAILEV